MIFITGCTGLVGSFIAKKFISEGHKIRALKRKNSDLSLIDAIEAQIDWVEGDILDFTLLEKSTKDLDCLIHCAALVSFSSKDRKEMYEINVEGTKNIVNLCLQNKIKKLCHISSVAALGRNKDTKQIDENAKWEESDFNTHYAKSKYLAEIEVWRGEAEGLNTLILNPSVVLGPGNWDKSSVQLFKYVWNQNSFYPKGSLNYVDVRDLADICFQLLQKPINSDRYILNAGNVSYKDFFDTTADFFKVQKPALLINPLMASLAWRLASIIAFLSGKSPFITKETALNAQKSYLYDNQKVKKLLNFNFRNIQDTIEWTCKELIKKNSIL